MNIIRKFILYSGLFSLLGMRISLGSENGRENKRAQMKINVSLYGKDVDSDSIQSRLAGTEIVSDFNYKFMEGLTANIAGGVTLEAGSSRFLFSNEYEPKQVPELKEANLAWQPFNFLSLRGGALDQDSLNTPLLLRNQSFPGISETLNYPFDSFIIKFFSQQSFGADTQNSQPSLHWKKEASMFFFDRLSLGYNSKNAISADFHLSHFLFRGLSALAASQSRFLGNTVNGEGTSISGFGYAFHGYELGGSISGILNPWLHPSIRASAVLNDGAPSGKNKGLRSEASWQFDLTENFRITPVAEYFYIQSDIAPALFNDPAVGHTNYQGYGVGADLIFPKQAAHVSFRFYDASVLTHNFYQSDMKWAQLLLSVNYDVLK
ncbi:MAG: hypothetical protein JWQ35_247 [Bacteriovoracaceae bacterium]|nr:hypothetical protein [Bacteriovoracaceae bacterium]